MENIPSHALQGRNPIDPKFYLRLIVRRRWVIATVLVLVLGGALLHLSRQQRVYQGTTSVVIDANAPQVLDKQMGEVVENGTGSYWFNKEYYQTQYKVITSRAVAQRVVEKLGLQADATFLGLTGVKDEKARADAMAKADAVGRLQSRIRVTPVRDSRLVNVVVEDTDAERAALLANEVADAYIAENMSLRLRVTDSAAAWLEEQLSSLDKQTRSSEIALFDYKKQADMLTTSLQDSQSMISQRLNSLNEELSTVRTKVAGLKARVDALKRLEAAPAEASDAHWAEGLQASIDSPLISQLKLRFMAQKAECEELSERYLSEHPKLAGCTEKLTETRQDLRRELMNVVRANDTELFEAQSKERNLSTLLDQVKADAFEVNRKQIEYDLLKREADNNRRLYDLVLKRVKDIELSGLLRTSNVRVLDAALPSWVPVRPNVRSTMILALLIGVVGALGLALLLEFLDNSITNQAEIEERLGLPFLGFIPSIPGEAAAQAQTRDLFIHHQPKSTVAESCRAIRTNLLFMSPDKPFKTMLVTSSAPQEGKSTSVISMGIAMAQSGNRVLVIDTDMRRPRLQKSFGVPNDVGVSSLVVGEGKLEDAIKSTEVPGLFVLPCGPIPPNPAELLHTKAFSELLATVSKMFDRVILDSPPIGPVADAVVLATQVDGVVLVVKAAKTSRDMARRSVRSLADVNAKLFGVILNSINLEDPKYGEYYYSYRRYGYYYGEKKDEAA